MDDNSQGPPGPERSRTAAAPSLRSAWPAPTTAMSGPTPRLDAKAAPGPNGAASTDWWWSSETPSKTYAAPVPPAVPGAPTHSSPPATASEVPKPAASEPSGGVTNRGAPRGLAHVERGDDAPAGLAGRTREQRAALESERRTEARPDGKALEDERAGRPPSVAIALEAVHRATATIAAGRAHDEQVGGDDEGGPEAIGPFGRWAAESARRRGPAVRPHGIDMDDAGLRGRRLAEARQVAEPARRSEEGGGGRHRDRAPRAGARLGGRVQRGALDPVPLPTLEQVGAAAPLLRSGGTDEEPLTGEGDSRAELVAHRARPGP